MIDYLLSETFLFFCAFTGSGIYLIQFLLNLLGTAEANEENSGADAIKFQWLSRQAMSGFLMMFGLSALTCKKEFDLEATTTLMISLSIGLFAILTTNFIFYQARKLHSPGSVFNLDEAIGKQGYVYQSIPKDGAGKISIALQQMTAEVAAISHDNEEISSFTTIQVIRKIDDNVLVVKAIEVTNG